MPITRISSITCIKGINGFNICVPQFIYFISNRPGKAESQDDAVGIKHQFYIDLSKLVSMGSTKYNVYQRQCAMLNIVYNSIKVKVSGRVRSCIAKLANSPKIDQDVIDSGEVCSELASFQSARKKESDWRNWRHKLVAESKLLVKPPIVVFNAGVFTEETLKIVLKSR